ncbi:glycosyltransferase, group 4 family [Leptospira borgpetersenii serovar Hardjo-bovis str. Sponselee]|uniref:Glycosyltransferase, group 4 family n=1 Tax=Leptospira borgpetersenii serovar Hardjo-bovis str. Sponselee TaxID=1303729 RepID=M6BBV7_LEPBO|nr:sugar phosphotransferase [Leptospira borgpetersenii]AYR07986.1 sugar phosphotransferase [Leptospira borgpetersenii serovar Hardjo-bovis]EMJ77212.1 glycosyltransferase, group 4 family [Leptospira borgpetersenii serovar Hardjo-bovis str. Sponselee]
MKQISFFWNPGLLCVLVFLVTFFFSWIYLHSKRFAISDISNERSMHVGTTKKSGGIWIFLPVFCLAAIWFGGFEIPDRKILLFFAGLLFFFLIGLSDDLLSLGSGIRLVLEFFFLLLLFLLEPIQFSFLGFDTGSVPGISTSILIVYVLFVVNVCNFMDGLDTYLPSHFLLAVLAFPFLFQSQLPSVFFWICAGVFGFLGFNLPKAKLFLGDVGSLPLGYSIAVLPLFFIDEYHWARFEITSAFFLLPVFFVDGVITILLRLKNRENILKAHRIHLYQLIAVSSANKGLVAFLFTAANLPAMFLFAIHRTVGIPGSIVFWFCLAGYTGLYFLLFRRFGFSTSIIDTEK